MTNESKLKLVKTAVKEWVEGKETAEQSMMNILTVVHIEPPSAACIKWATETIAKLKKQNKDHDL